MSRYIEDESKLKYPAVGPMGRDMMAWAKRIMFREQQQDKTLLPIQIQFAKQALGIKDTENK